MKWKICVGRGTRSSPGNIIFWTMNRTLRKYLDLLADDRGWKCYFCTNILWRKKDICMDKINELIGFFSRVLMLAQFQVQQSTGGNLLHEKDLGARRPFSWEMVGREYLPEAQRAMEPVSASGPGGWTCLSNCQLEMVPHRRASVILCSSSPSIPVRTPTTSLEFTDSSVKIFLPASQLKSSLFRIFPLPLFLPL